MSWIPLWFKVLFCPVRERMVEVKNVSPSPSYGGSAIADWESYKGIRATLCSRCAKPFDNEDDKVGGHVVKRYGSSIDQYIVPLCKQCNNRTIVDYYNVDESLMVRVKDLKRRFKN